MKSRLPGVESTFGYTIDRITGVPTWGLFSEIAVRAQNIFIEQANLLIPTIVASLLCVLGLRLFRKRAGEMVDEL